MKDEKKKVIAELVEEVEGIQNIAEIRFILSIVRNCKKTKVKCDD